MKIKYVIYVLKCKATHKMPVDFVDYIGYELFIRKNA